MYGGTVSLAKNENVELTSWQVITATSGSITVETYGTKITIGALDSGDKFTVNDGSTTKTYTMTNAGIVIDGKLYLVSNKQFPLETVGYEMYFERSIVIDKKNLYIVDSEPRPAGYNSSSRRQ